MRTILTTIALLITLATKVGAECVNLCNIGWWSSATLEDLEVQSNIAASLNLRDKYGNTPLHLAANKSTPRTIGMLLDSGARLEARNISGRTPLHMAADYGSAESVKALLNAGAKVMVRDDKGETPLFSAAAWATSASLQYLLNAGADVNAVNVAGEIALHNAAGWGTSDNVLILLDAGSNVHAKANNDKTSWDYAQSNESLWGTAGFWALNDARFK